MATLGNVNNKNVLLNLYSSIRKKNQKDSVDFLCRKIDFDSQILALFETSPLYTNSQNSMISFAYSWFLAKNLCNFVSLSWKIHNRYCHTVKQLQFTAYATAKMPIQYTLKDLETKITIRNHQLTAKVSCWMSNVKFLPKSKIHGNWSASFGIAGVFVNAKWI